MRIIQPPLLFILFIFNFSSLAFAVESRSDREKTITPRSKRFYHSRRSRSYISFSGKYVSDERAREREIRSRYYYQSNNFVNEMNFLTENKYTNKGSSKNKRHLIKRSELYDISVSSKARISKTQNYGVLFHRTIYDDMSKYYRDSQTTAGFGRIFLKNKIEVDAGFGYRDSKSFGYKFNFSPSWRAKFKLTDKITFKQRGYLFIDHEAMDTEIKTGLTYRVGSKVSLELRFNFDQRRYEDDDNLETINKVDRSVTFGIVFDLS